MARSTAVAVALVVALVALTALPHGAAAACNAKPNPYDTKSKDLVGDWLLPCDAPANIGCPSCSLFSKTVSGKSGQYVYSGSQSGVPRAKIIPTRPLQGLESIVRDKHDLSSLFTQALVDASKGGVLPNKGTTLGPAAHPIAFINSLNAREQHQAHVHVGEAANKNFYNCVSGILKAPPTAGTWSTTYDPKSAACQALKVHQDVSIAATSSAGNNISNTIREGFAKHIKGATSKDIQQDPAKLHTGVLVQPNPKVTGEYLVFLLSNVNDVTVFGNKT